MSEYKVIGKRVGYLTEQGENEYWEPGTIIRGADVAAGRISYPALEALDKAGRVEKLKETKNVKSADLEKKG